jgi:ferrous iron transport protein B
VFVAAWTTGLAYTAATLFYQAATFSRHPLSSAAWIVSLLSLLALVIVGFRYWGARQPEAVGLPGKA